MKRKLQLIATALLALTTIGCTKSTTNVQNKDESTSAALENTL